MSFPVQQDPGAAPKSPDCPWELILGFPFGQVFLPAFLPFLALLISDSTSLNLPSHNLIHNENSISCFSTLSCSFLLDETAHFPLLNGEQKVTPQKNETNVQGHLRGDCYSV